MSHLIYFTELLQTGMNWGLKTTSLSADCREEETSSYVDIYIWQGSSSSRFPKYEVASFKENFHRHIIVGASLQAMDKKTLTCWCLFQTPQLPMTCHPASTFHGGTGNWVFRYSTDILVLFNQIWVTRYRPAFFINTVFFCIKYLQWTYKKKPKTAFSEEVTDYIHKLMTLLLLISLEQTGSLLTQQVCLISYTQSPRWVKKWLPRKDVQSPSFEAMKTQLDKDLSNLVWSHSWPSLEQEVRPETSWSLL